MKDQKRSNATPPAVRYTEESSNDYQKCAIYYRRGEGSNWNAVIERYHKWANVIKKKEIYSSFNAVVVVGCFDMKSLSAFQYSICGWKSSSLNKLNLSLLHTKIHSRTRETHAANRHCRRLRYLMWRNTNFVFFSVDFSMTRKRHEKEMHSNKKLSLFASICVQNWNETIQLHSNGKRTGGGI